MPQSLLIGGYVLYRAGSALCRFNHPPPLPQPWVSLLALLPFPQCPPTFPVANPLPLTATLPSGAGGKDTPVTSASVSGDQAIVLSSELGAAPTVSQCGGQDQVRPVRADERSPSGQHVPLHAVGGAPRATQHLRRPCKATAVGDPVPSDQGVVFPGIHGSAHL